jgi:hypothetical protein
MTRMTVTVHTKKPFNVRLFERLGNRVEEAWRRADYSDSSFPNIAKSAIEEADFLKDLDPESILSWVLTTPVLPQQQDTMGRFGQPPVTLFYGPRFCIDVYFWMESTTTIHDHGFCGAFTVLQGSSVQTRYLFKNRREINPYFYAGELSCEGAEMLRLGEVRAIHPGEEFIHSVFHLEHPSVTLCIRTLDSCTPHPQCDFYPPYFAQSPFYVCPTKNKKVAAAETLVRIGHPTCDAVVKRALSTADFQTTFAVLRSCWIMARGDKNDPRFQGWLGVARERHPELSEWLIPTFSEVQRQGILLYRRSTVTQKEHRFFLAVFLTITSREAMLIFVQREYPDQDPVRLLVDWLRELSQLQLPDSFEENALGLPGIDRDYLIVFEGLLRGFSLEQILATFEKEYSAEYVAEQRDHLEALMVEIQNTEIFAPQLKS